jgi:hypothetical protein
LQTHYFSENLVKPGIESGPDEEKREVLCNIAALSQVSIMAARLEYAPLQLLVFSDKIFCLILLKVEAAIKQTQPNLHETRH